MPFDLKELPGEPIIISTLLSPFDVENDLRMIGDKTKRILQETQGSYYFITDTTHLDHVTFGQVVFGLVAVTKGAASFLLKDARLKPVFVANSGLAKFAAESLSQKQYGGMNFRIFRSLEEALAYSRQEITANQ
jgi:hypothetical protein